jgi:hypothetical protein
VLILEVASPTAFHITVVDVSDDALVGLTGLRGLYVARSHFVCRISGQGR